MRCVDKYKAGILGMLSLIKHELNANVALIVKLKTQLIPKLSLIKSVCVICLKVSVINEY